MQKFKKFVQIPALVFSLIMLCLTAMLGAACTPGPTTGKSFELSINEENRSWVVFKVSAPTTVDKQGKETRMNVKLHDVYIHMSKICSDEQTATLELQWGASTTPADSFFTLSAMKKVVLFNPDYVQKEGDTRIEESDKYSNYVHDWRYKWVAPFGVSELDDESSYRNMSSDLYFRLVIPLVNSKYKNSNVVIDEIVFVGEVLDGEDGTGRYVVLPTEIDERTRLPYDSEVERQEDVFERAKALLDVQRIPKI